MFLPTSLRNARSYSKHSLSFATATQRVCCCQRQSRLSPPSNFGGRLGYWTRRYYIAATVTTSNGVDDVSRLVARLDRTCLATTTTPSFSARTVLLLLSSALSTQLYHDWTFVQNTIKCLPNTVPLPRKVIVGVVDQVGAATTGVGLHCGPTEGLVVVVLEDHEYETDRMDSTATTSKGGELPEPPVLSFHLSSKPRLQSLLQPPAEVNVPVANTLFQLGRPNLLAQYTISDDGTVIARGDLQKLALYLKLQAQPQSQSHQQQQRVLSESSQDGSSESICVPQLNLQIPLFALTQPLRVTDAMGNIVRQVSDRVPANPTGRISPPRPASLDLERSVSNFSKIRNERPHAMEVYTLVIPPHVDNDPTTIPPVSLEDIDRNWQRQEPLADSYISQMLSKGCTLHKVLSGGGEWGERAGLISISYQEESYRTVVPETQEIMFPDFMMGDDGLRSVLKTIAPPGHFIQYFAAAIKGDGFNLEVDTEIEQETRETIEGSIFLGTIPNGDDSHDTAPSYPTVINTDEACESEITISDYHLGILSQRGINIVFSPSNPSPSSQESGANSDGTQIELSNAHLAFSLQSGPSHMASESTDITSSPSGSSVSRTQCVSPLSSSSESYSHTPVLSSIDNRILQAITSGTSYLADIKWEYSRYSRAIRRYHRNALLAAIEGVIHKRNGRVKGGVSGSLSLPGIRQNAWPPLWSPLTSTNLPIEVPLGLARLQTNPRREYFWWEGLMDWKPMEAMNVERYVRTQIASLSPEEWRLALDDRGRILNEWLDKGGEGLDEVMAVETEQARKVVGEMLKKAFRAPSIESLPPPASESASGSELASRSGSESGSESLPVLSRYDYHSIIGTDREGEGDGRDRRRLGISFQLNPYFGK